MKTLALGDPHGKLPKNLDSIIAKNKIELIICVGEVYPITRTGQNSGQADLKTGEKIIEKLNSYNIPVILMKGNMFLSKGWPKYFRNLIKKHKNIINKKLTKYKFKNKTFVILDMIYEKRSHPNLPQHLIGTTQNEKRKQRLIHLLTKNENAILLSHAPPYKILDKTSTGKHIGSKILLQTIKQAKPKLTLCGHIHEAKGKAKIGKTQIINLGSHGDYQILEI